MRLTQRNVYVLPSRAGMLYAAILLAMLIASINYALSLGFMLTFLLGAIAVVAMLHTFRNLVALVLRPVTVRQFREDGVLIADGLKPGERIAAAGVHKIVAGQPLRAMQAAAPAVAAGS